MHELDSETGAPEPASAGGSDRVEGLERSVRRLWIALGAVSLAAVAGALAPLATQQSVAMHELAITDAEGRTRILLTAADGEGRLEHYDAQGRLRVAQETLADGKASFVLLDPGGARRIGAAAFADGDAGLAILDSAGRVRIQLISESDGLAGTVHLDPQGRKRIETFAAADGRALHSFLDPSGGVRLQLGTRPDGSPVSSQPQSAELAAAEDEVAAVEGEQPAP